MKPFLGIDLTTDKKNEQVNGDVFLAAKPSLALVQSLERSSENADETIEKSKLSLPLRVGQWICGAVGALVAMGILRGMRTVTLSIAYQNAPWLFWLGGISLLIWGLLKLIGNFKAKVVLETDESTHTFDNLEKVCDAILTELKVPENSREVDVLSFFYKAKGDTIKVCEKFTLGAPYMNPEFHLFADSENLYLANLEGKYAIPLSAIRRIKTVKKTIRIAQWNKDTSFDKGIYKQYKLTENQYGNVFCKYYHIMEVEYQNELWGVYIPCYELPFFEKLTRLKATSI